MAPLCFSPNLLDVTEDSKTLIQQKKRRTNGPII